MRPRPVTGLGTVVDDVVGSALGVDHRDDPVAPRTGGPAGNARLTAWTGLALLVLFFVEGVTLLALRPMITVHLAVGAFLVPLALLKTATTGWRMIRYYAGDPRYRAAGPPPLALRVLGPLVVLTALAVLGTGLVLVAIGRSAREDLWSVAGVGVTPLTLHQAAFVAWFAVTTLHVLTRTVPAVQIARDRRAARSMRVPGGRSRAGVLAVTTVAGVVTAAVVLAVAGGEWSQRFGDDGSEGARGGATPIAVTSTPH